MTSTIFFSCPDNNDFSAGRAWCTRIDSFCQASSSNSICLARQIFSFPKRDKKYYYGIKCEIRKGQVFFLFFTPSGRLHKEIAKDSLAGVAHIVAEAKFTHSDFQALPF